LLEKEKAEFSILRGSKDDIITINVGGKKFSTIRENLLKVKGSKLDVEILSIKYPLRDNKRRFFIDRDPTFFGYIMNYIRGEKIPPLNEYEKQRLAEEFEYFGISVQAQKK
jgi:hypothetical protein